MGGDLAAFSWIYAEEITAANEVRLNRQVFLMLLGIFSC
jgi:hypothetical protein